jgi:hypothetical protein
MVEAEHMNTFRHPRAWLHRKFRLYPVCAHSFHVVEPPIKITVTRDWVEAIAPALVWNIALMRGATDRVIGLECPLTIDDLEEWTMSLRAF